jgi:hypothetical protein
MQCGNLSNLLNAIKNGNDALCREKRVQEQHGGGGYQGFKHFRE